MKNNSVLLLLFLSSCLAGNNLNKGGHSRQIGIIPEATLARSSSYEILGRSEGESSTFMFLGIFPATRPLSIEYAMNQAVSKIPGGNSMINITIWHETHYYFLLGRVSVVKVEGDVIALSSRQN